MPGVSLQVVSRNLRRLAALFRAGADAGTLRRIREMILDDVQSNFRESHDPDGEPWAPLKDKKAGHLPLVKTGLLAASLSSRGGAALELTANGIRLGTPVPYASFHQFGTRTIPQRRFLGLGKKLKARIAEVVREGLADLLRQLADGGF